MTNVVCLHGILRIEFNAVHIIEMRCMGGQVYQFMILALADRSRMCYELFGYVIALALKAKVVEGMFYVDGARFAIEAEAQPVVHFKGKDVGRGADLQYEVVLTRTVYRTIRDQVEPVLLRVVALYKSFNVYFFIVLFAVLQRFAEGSGINVV